MANEIHPHAVDANDVRTPNPSGTGMSGSPDDADAGKPTPGISADAPHAITVTAPVLDPPPGTIKQHQPGKDASGNAHHLDHIPVQGWVDHVNVGVDGTPYNAHTAGIVMRPNPRKHQGEKVPPGHSEANPLTKSTEHSTTPTVQPTITPSDPPK